MSGGRVLSTSQIRQTKMDRGTFRATPRRPVHLLLDGVRRNYNLGAIFRLCDAMSVEQLIVCGLDLDVHKRKFSQAAQGAQHWVTWVQGDSAAQMATLVKQRGFHLVVAEITTTSVPPHLYTPKFPMCLVVGNERTGVSQPVVDMADAAVAVPMLGMCNSLNVATATAVILHQLLLHAPSPCMEQSPHAGPAVSESADSEWAVQ